MAENEQPDLTQLTVQLLSAYVSNNQVPNEDLAKLITATRSALGSAAEPATPAAPEYEPAVTVRKSLASRDHILSLIDGKPYRSLKRHLGTHGLTPAEYRERYKLPKTYPMVAPGYSEERREVAKRLGLGRKPVAAPAPAAEVKAKAETAPPAAPRAAPAKKAAAPTMAAVAAKASAPAKTAAPAAAKTAKPKAASAGRKKATAPAPAAAASKATTAAASAAKPAKAAKPKPAAKASAPKPAAAPKAEAAAAAPAKKPSKPRAAKPAAKAAAEPAAS